jgi:hypothetical protein
VITRPARRRVADRGYPEELPELARLLLRIMTPVTIIYGRRMSALNVRASGRKPARSDRGGCSLAGPTRWTEPLFGQPSWSVRPSIDGSTVPHRTGTRPAVRASARNSSLASAGTSSAEAARFYGSSSALLGGH